jgi:hypothetical protein
MMPSSIACMIPVDFNDYIASTYAQTESDARPATWCTEWSKPGQTDFWMNENVSLFTPTGTPVVTARIGAPVNVQVGIQPTAMPVDPGVNITSIQAWAFYPYAFPGPPTYDDMLPSMKARFPGGTPTSPGFANPLEPPTDQNPPYGYNPVAATLGNPWTPVAADVMPPNTEVHCCLLATCYGTTDAATIGTQVENQADVANLMVCSSPWVGQKNLTLISAERAGPLTLARFGFIAGGPWFAERTQISVEVRPVESASINPVVLRDLSDGPFRDLPFRPAGGVKRLHLRPNEYAARQFAERSDPAEEVLHDPAAGEDGESGNRRLRLRMPPRSVQPLLLEVELDNRLPGGSVFECDLVQTGPGRGVGGIRVAVVVPD